MNNNPLKYTDPSGHDPKGNCYDKGYCMYEDLTPASLIENEKDRLGHCNNAKNQCQETYGYSKLTGDIENYLKTHPDYDPGKDPAMIDKFGNSTVIGMEFNYQREVYWVQRAQDAGLCTLMCQSIARQLTRYYDYHETFTAGGWDLNRIDRKSIVMDAALIPLAFYSSAYRTLSEPMQGIVGITNVTGAAASISNGDPAVNIITAIGLYPPAAPFAAVALFTLDLGDGFYTYNYVPPIPR